MKKLKTILIAILLLQSIVSFGQTKEETLEWLNTNGKDLANCSVEYDCGSGPKCVGVTYLMNFSKDSISYVGGSAVSDFDHINKGTLSTVAYKDILFQDVSTLKKTGDKLKWIQIKTKPNAKVHFDQETKITEYDTDMYFLYKNEEDTKRVLKAIMHLAKLSGAKENKQTF